ncbi:hypothetical protein BDW71DRAFT_179828 [Aspergillus fruticulosus]
MWGNSTIELSPAVCLTSAFQRDFEFRMVRLRERLSGIPSLRKELRREEKLC